MFNIFKPKQANELHSHMQNLVNDINLNGGAIKFCGDFAEIVINDELFKTLGVINLSKLPQPKSQLMIASILLLKDIKNPPMFLTEENLEYMKAVSKAAFVYSNTAVNDEELGELLLMPSSNALAHIKNQREKYELAWNEWLTTDIDIETLIYSLKNKLL